MKLILRQDIKSLGKVGETINVSEGYARNYLLPKKLAMVATPGSLSVIEKEKTAQIRREQKVIESFKQLAGQLKTKSYTIPMKAGENDKLYGSVTAADIAELIKADGFDIDKKQIMLEEPLNVLGVFPIKIKLYSDVIAEVKVWIVKE